MNKKVSARLTYEVFDQDGNKIDKIRRNFYDDEEGHITTFISEMYFFVRKCMSCCESYWDKYFWLPGDDHVKMVLDTSLNTTKEHLDEAEARIKHARKVIKRSKK